jgi:hypothetical protein
MEATVLLCDFAEEVGGKLYIMGAGWSRLKRPRVPTTMCLAVKLTIPWDESQAVHKLKAELMTSDNETVTLDGRPVRVTGEVHSSPNSEASRDVPLDVNLALRFDGITLDPGRYAWRFEVDDQALATVPFLVLPAEEAAATEAAPTEA